MRGSGALIAFTTPGAPRRSRGTTGLADGRMRRAGEEHALEARRDVGGREGSPVVEADPVAEPERPGEAVARDLPLDGEPGLDVARALAVVEQGVEELAREHAGGRVGGERGIERGGSAGTPTRRKPPWASGAPAGQREDDGEDDRDAAARERMP